MPKTELDGLPVIDAPESEEITVAVSGDDMEAGDMKKPAKAPAELELLPKPLRLEGRHRLFARPIERAAAVGTYCGS
jgi:hypothetical protein